MDYLSKKDIRKFISDKRDAVHIKQKGEWDDKIFNRLINSEFYRNADVIFAFVSFRSEVDTHRFISYAIEDKKTICVPKIRSKQRGMELFRIESLSDLEPGFFGVLEPKDTCPEANIGDIDLVLMPGMAFDREGGRVGYGGGFYDKFLVEMGRKVHSIALAYDFQVLDEVPMDSRDIPIDGVITDKELILTSVHDTSINDSFVIKREL